MKNLKGLGGVRELSYDPRYARPLGQTAAEITEDARRQAYADLSGNKIGNNVPHVPKPDRFYLLRFLNVSE